MLVDDELYENVDEAKAKGAPPWVQSLYPAYAWLVDLSEWWIKFARANTGVWRQIPDPVIMRHPGKSVT